MKPLYGAYAAAFTLLTTPAMALDCADDLRAFTHRAGETCIPVEPQRIAAPDGYTATPLIELGAPLIATSGEFNSETGETEVRYAFEVFGTTLENAGLQSIGGPDGSVDFEALAAATPDLIIIDFWSADSYDKFAAIAPTVVEVTDFGFEERMRFMADASRRMDIYEDRFATYQTRLDAARAQIGDPSTIVISRLDIWEGKFWHYRGWGALAKVIADLGFAEPEIFTSMDAKEAEFSAESIEDADGDLILSSYALPFGQSIEMLSADWDQSAPVWRNIPGVAAGNHYWVDRNIVYSDTFEGLERTLDLIVTLTAQKY